MKLSLMQQFSCVQKWMMCLYLQLSVSETDFSVSKPDSDRESLASALFSGIESVSASSHIVHQVIF